MCGGSPLMDICVVYSLLFFFISCRGDSQGSLYLLYSRSPLSEPESCSGFVSIRCRGDYTGEETINSTLVLPSLNRLIFVGVLFFNSDVGEITQGVFYFNSRSPLCVFNEMAFCAFYRFCIFPTVIYIGWWGPCHGPTICIYIV